MNMRKMRGILRRSPDITAGELSRELRISANYASSLLRTHRKAASPARHIANAIKATFSAPPRTVILTLANTMDIQQIAAVLNQFVPTPTTITYQHIYYYLYQKTRDEPTQKTTRAILKILKALQK